jgi:uncharacterized tellurite resistance protein B-like protein
MSDVSKLQELKDDYNRVLYAFIGKCDELEAQKRWDVEQDGQMEAYFQNVLYCIVLRIASADGKFTKEERKYLHEIFDTPEDEDSVRDLFIECGDSVDEMFNTQIDDSIKKLEGKDPETADLFKNLIYLICEIVVASDESLAGAEKELVERIKRYLD